MSISFMTIWTAFVGQTWSFAPAQMIQLLKFGILRGAKKSVHCPVMCFEDSKEWKKNIFSLKLHMHWVLNQIPHSPSHFTGFAVMSDFISYWRYAMAQSKPLFAWDEHIWCIKMHLMLLFLSFFVYCFV